MSAFDNSKFEQYKAEAKEKWGNTDAYREYEEKAKAQSQDSVQSAADGMDAIFAEFAYCMKNGEAADSTAAQALVKKLQQHITDNFYTCTKAILAGLGQMYVLDERFQKNIDKHDIGTAAFVSASITHYTKG